MDRQINRRAGPHEGLSASPRRTRKKTAGRLIAVLATIALGLGTSPAMAGNASAGPALGDVSVFASAPAPGHPFGIAVDDKRVYVSTLSSSGSRATRG